MNHTFLVLLFALVGTLVQAQSDPVLFTVGNREVHLSEFEYIYNKTNADKDKTEASVREHLDLYKKFKLKVAYALEQKIDTIAATREELDKYKFQLSDAYLVDKEVVEKLAQELYNRKQYDVEIAHIMVALPQGADDVTINVARRKIDSLYQALTKGANFETLAKSHSDDPSAKKNFGKLGYVNAMLPNGFHELEEAIYSVPVGQFSKPVQSKAGLHIIKVLDKRNARGEIEAAHIFVRDSEKSPNPNAKKTIEEAYQALASKPFPQVVKTYSEDNQTVKDGGYIGFFGINKFDKKFEDIAFGLTKDSEYSKPFQTQAGWHIVKRISKRESLDFEKQKPRLIEMVKKDSRFEAKKQSLLENIKNQYNLTTNTAAWNRYLETLDPQFTSFRWQPGAENAEEVLVSFDEHAFTIADFEAFAKNRTRERLQKGRQEGLKNTAEYVYELFVDDAALKVYQEILPQKYPELKALIREYEEGILLFEITKQNVWDKANEDTLGLKKFWASNIKGTNKYAWDDRATIVFYELDKKAEKLLPKLRKWAVKKDSDFITKKINASEKLLTILRQTFEKGQRKEVDNLQWKEGFLSPTKTNENGAFTFMKVAKVLPPMEKELSEARGYIVAEYQDYLEKQWVKELADRYPIQVKEEVLQAFIER